MSGPGLSSRAQAADIAHGLSGSRRLLERAKRVTPGGVNSNVRFWERPEPIFFDRSEGSRLYDVDGNTYIDYALGQGPILLGHQSKTVLDSVRRQLASGVIFGAQHEIEVRAAELVAEMVPSAESIRFNVTGTEAVQAAIRLARANTGRSKVLKFEGHYHGWVDSVLFNVAKLGNPLAAEGEIEPVAESEGISPVVAQDLVVVGWNDADSLTRVMERHDDQLAAVIMEPIMANSGVIEPQPGYLQKVRELCNRYGVILIFDEVITGFRVDAGGAQGLYGVIPDLTVFGKAMAAGFPIGCIAGRADLFDAIGQGRITHAGTFNASPVSMSAVVATLELIRDEGFAFYQELNDLGARLMRGLQEINQGAGLGQLIQGPPPVFNIMFSEEAVVQNHRQAVTANAEALEKYLDHMVARGVRFSGHGNVMLSKAHTADDVDFTLEQAQAVAEVLARSA